jgi:putative ABC transport system substrate-binding protein
MKRREFVAGLAGTAVWPLAARAQQPRRVGILEAGGSYSQGQAGDAFRRTLEILGWSEGKNIQFIARAALGEDSRALEFARELSGLSVDVILATNTQMVQALHKVTRDIPIVFVQVPDPIGSGLVDSLSRPSGNRTGFTNFDPSMASKWLQLLKEIAPRVSKVAVLLHAGNPTAPGYFRAVEAGAPAFHLSVTPASVRDAVEIGSSLAALEQAVSGVIIPPSSMAGLYQDQIVSLLSLLRLPAVSSYREYTASGGLMSYGYDRIDQNRQAAQYVDRILRGTRSIDLPVQLPSKFELVINLKTAKTLGLTVPQSLLARADEVIE